MRGSRGFSEPPGVSRAAIVPTMQNLEAPIPVIAKQVSQHETKSSSSNHGDRPVQSTEASLPAGPTYSELPLASSTGSAHVHIGNPRLDASGAITPVQLESTHQPGAELFEQAAASTSLAKSGPSTAAYHSLPMYLGPPIYQRATTQRRAVTGSEREKLELPRDNSRLDLAGLKITGAEGNAGLVRGQPAQPVVQAHRAIGSSLYLPLVQRTSVATSTGHDRVESGFAASPSMASGEPATASRQANGNSTISAPAVHRKLHAGQGVVSSTDSTASDVGPLDGAQPSHIFSSSALKLQGPTTPLAFTSTPGSSTEEFLRSRSSVTPFMSPAQSFGESLLNRHRESLITHSGNIGSSARRGAPVIQPATQLVQMEQMAVEVRSRSGALTAASKTPPGASVASSETTELTPECSRDENEPRAGTVRVPRAPSETPVAKRESPAQSDIVVSGSMPALEVRSRSGAPTAASKTPLSGSAVNSATTELTDATLHDLNAPRAGTVRASYASSETPVAKSESMGQSTIVISGATAAVFRTNACRSASIETPSGSHPVLLRSGLPAAPAIDTPATGTSTSPNPALQHSVASFTTSDAKSRPHPAGLDGLLRVAPDAVPAVPVGLISRRYDDALRGTSMVGQAVHLRATEGVEHEVRSDADSGAFRVAQIPAFEPEHAGFEKVYAAFSSNSHPASSLGSLSLHRTFRRSHGLEENRETLSQTSGLTFHGLSPVSKSHAHHPLETAQSSTRAMARDTTLFRVPADTSPAPRGTAPSVPTVSSAAQPLGGVMQTKENIDVTALANRVYDLLVQRLSSERQRRGA